MRSRADVRKLRDYRFAQKMSRRSRTRKGPGARAGGERTASEAEAAVVTTAAAAGGRRMSRPVSASEEKEKKLPPAVLVHTRKHTCRYTATYGTVLREGTQSTRTSVTFIQDGDYYVHVSPAGLDSNTGR